MTEKEYDIYRDSLLRYAGYANEVGESFRAIIGPKWVLATYAAATTYVIADAYDKGSKTYKKCVGQDNCTKKVAFVGTDVLIWQMLASVVVPGFTINRICAGSNYLLKNVAKLKGDKRKWTVTAIGLMTIPFIIRPIDHMIDTLMDRTFRKYKP